MKVTVLKETYKTTREEIKANAHADSSIFYILILQKGRQRYLKIGTTTKTLAQRLSNQDYKKYTNIKDYLDIDIFTEEAKGIESIINNATKDDNNVYTLYLSNVLDNGIIFLAELFIHLAKWSKDRGSHFSVKAREIKAHAGNGIYMISSSNSSAVRARVSPKDA